MSAGAPRRRRPLPEVERAVEQQLREMAEAGELSGLPGEGRPLSDDGPADERWAATRLMKSAGAAPEWSDLRKEINAREALIVHRARRHLAWLRSREAHLATSPADGIVESLRTTRAVDTRVRAELEAAVAGLNTLIARYDLIVPVAALQMAPYTLDGILSEAGSA